MIAMNIFALSINPYWASRFLCNKHLAKMLLESCQLLANHHELPKYTCTTELALGESYQYKPTHQGHPCSVWLSDSPTLCYLSGGRKFTYNQLWLLLHAIGIYEAYMDRYGTIKAAKRKCWSNQLLPHGSHKCAIPLQKLTYQVLEATGTSAHVELFSLLWDDCNRPRFTPHNLAMPEQYKLTDDHHAAVQSYRSYYVADKQRFAKWDGRVVPHWWPT